MCLKWRRKNPHRAPAGLFSTAHLPTTTVPKYDYIKKRF